MQTPFGYRQHFSSAVCASWIVCKQVPRSYCLKPSYEQREWTFMIHSHQLLDVVVDFSPGTRRSRNSHEGESRCGSFLHISNLNSTLSVWLTALTLLLTSFVGCGGDATDPDESVVAIPPTSSPEPTSSPTPTQTSSPTPFSTALASPTASPLPTPSPTLTTTTTTPAPTASPAHCDAHACCD